MGLCVTFNIWTDEFADIFGNGYQKSKMSLLVIFPAVAAFICSTLNVGTDSDRFDDIIKRGLVNRTVYPAAWNAATPTQRISPAQSEFYIYVEKFELFGPEFDVNLNSGERLPH